MKIIHGAAIMTSCLMLLWTGCKRSQESNKIIDNLPVNANITVIPAQITQQMLLLKRDAAQTIVPIINRIGLQNQVYPELTGPNGSSQYTFIRTENHYGTANFTIQFRDSLNNVIDPIQTQISTTSLSSVIITVTGASANLTFSENLVLTLETAGNTESKKRVTGTSGFNGLSYSVTFTFSSPGVTCSFEGLTEGTITGSGAGGPSNSSANISLSISASHAADGSITWEGNQGGIHIENNGSGYVVTDQYLVLIQ